MCFFWEIWGVGKCVKCVVEFLSCTVELSEKFCWVMESSVFEMFSDGVDVGLVAIKKCVLDGGASLFCSEFILILLFGRDFMWLNKCFCCVLIGIMF